MEVSAKLDTCLPSVLKLLHQCQMWPTIVDRWIRDNAAHGARCSNKIVAFGRKGQKATVRSKAEKLTKISLSRKKLKTIHKGINKRRIEDVKREKKETKRKEQKETVIQIRITRNKIGKDKR